MEAAPPSGTLDKASRSLSSVSLCAASNCLAASAASGLCLERSLHLGVRLGDELLRFGHVLLVLAFLVGLHVEQARPSGAWTHCCVLGLHSRKFVLE